MKIMNEKRCARQDCDRPVVAKGLCMTHYQAARRADRPSTDVQPRWGSYTATVGGQRLSLNTEVRVTFNDGSHREVRLTTLTDLIASGAFERDEQRA